MPSPRKPKPRSKPGPKPAIDAKAEAEILAALSVGATLQDAADYVGLDRRTLLNQRNRDDNFSRGVVRASARGKVLLLNKIAKDKAWQAAAWILERKYGSEWGRKDRIDLTTKGDKLPGGIDPRRLPPDKLRALIELLDEATPPPADE